jgi:metal-responsive CopG/Arc/MetJ family transcriptional regulator
VPERTGDRHHGVQLGVRVPSDLMDALTLYLIDRDEAGEPMRRSDLVNAAVREYLKARGYWPLPGENGH